MMTVRRELEDGTNGAMNAASQPIYSKGAGTMTPVSIKSRDVFPVEKMENATFQGAASTNRSPMDRSMSHTPALGTPDLSNRFPRPAFALQVPSLLDAPMEDFRKSDYNIRDTSGERLLTINIMRPAQEQLAVTEADFRPAEYVTLCSIGSDDELAMCALGTKPGSHEWECHVYQGENELFGYIVEEQGVLAKGINRDSQFALLSYPHSERMLWVKGKIQERKLHVFSHRKDVTAYVEPGTGLGEPDTHYTVTCLPDANVGLVVLLLLGIDRIHSHRGTMGIHH